MTEDEWKKGLKTLTCILDTVDESLEAAAEDRPKRRAIDAAMRNHIGNLVAGWSSPAGRYYIRDDATPELCEILLANDYMMKRYKAGEISIHEYKRRALIAAQMKQRHSDVHAEELAADPDYFNRLADSMGDGCSGYSYMGYAIPTQEEVFKLEGGVLPPDEPIPF